MSKEFTDDDALDEPVEDRTQPMRSQIDDDLDLTQDISGRWEETSPLLQSTQPSEPVISESAMARIIEDDLDGAGTRFRPLLPVAEDIGELGKKEEELEKEVNKESKKGSKKGSAKKGSKKKRSKKGSKKSSKKSKKWKGRRVLRWKDVRVTKMEKGKVERVILDGIGGKARAGQLTFIMGSSGAGKTTLLNVLTGRTSRNLETSGEVTINGRSVSSSEMKSLSAFVQQEDVFIASQTVAEVLHFSVKMRSPEVLSSWKREGLVEEMLKTFNLKQCQDTKIGSLREKGLSRGEKKRLAFACEILTDPPILFCDEPTSGLDSFMSHQVMNCLKNLAKEGKIIVCTIHQPSTWVYQMADRLTILCQGQVAFEGPTKKVEKFLEKIGSPLPELASISDHFIRVLSRDVGETWEDYVTRTSLIVGRQKSLDSISKSPKSHRSDKAVEEPKKVIHRSWCFQFSVLVSRGFIQISRRKKYIAARLILTVLVSWFLGMVYLQIPIHKDNLLAIKGVIFATLQMNNILYMMPSLISFWEDYPVVVREHQSNMYSPSAYFMARSFTDSILHLFFPIIFFAIIYFMTGLPITVIGISTFLSMSIAMSMIITSLSHAVVSLCGNVTMSLTVAPLISVPVMVFGGFLITVDAVPPYYKPLSYVSWYHYAFEAVMIAFFEDIGHIDGCSSANSTLSPIFDMECSTGLKLIHDQDFHVGHFWWDFVAVAGILVFWKVFGLAAFMLRIRYR